MKAFRSLVLIAAAATAITAAGCGGEGESGSSNDSGGEGEPVNLALFVPATSTSYYTSAVDGVKEEASKNNATVEVFDPNYDPQEQLSQCQDALTSGSYDAMIAFPVDGGAVVPCARQAIEEDVPFIGMGGPVGPDWETLEPQVEGVTGYAFPLAQTSGERLAALAERACEGIDPCELLYQIGNPAFGYDSTLLTNFEESLPDGIEIAAEVQTNFNPDDGRTKTIDALQADPDIDVIVTEDTTARGVIPALEDAGRAGKVKVISGGGSEYATSQVKAGTIVGTVPYHPYQSALLTTDWAIKAARGEELADEVYVDEHTLGDVELVTPETVDEWVPEYE